MGGEERRATWKAGRRGTPGDKECKALSAERRGAKEAELQLAEEVQSCGEDGAGARTEVRRFGDGGVWRSAA